MKNKEFSCFRNNMVRFPPFHEEAIIINYIFRNELDQNFMKNYFLKYFLYSKI